MEECVRAFERLVAAIDSGTDLAECEAEFAVLETAVTVSGLGGDPEVQECIFGVAANIAAALEYKEEVAELVFDPR